VIKRSFFTASFFDHGTKRGYNSTSTVVLTSTDTAGIVFVIGRDSEPRHEAYINTPRLAVIYCDDRSRNWQLLQCRLAS